MANKGPRKQKTGNKHKFAGRNNGPSRQRYWLYGTLEKHKVKAIMRDTGLSREAATRLWKGQRQGRMK